MIGVEFSVPIQPIGKARARVTSRGTFTPTTTKAAERDVQVFARAAMRGRAPLAGPLAATVDAYFPIPPSWPASRRRAALANAVRPISRPDADNVAKLVLDACNGIAFDDDSQVVSLLVRKFYAASASIRVAIAADEPRSP